MRHTPGLSWRQMEENRDTTRPWGSWTGPVLSASVPEASTSTLSGSQENGASGPSKKRRQYSATGPAPCSGSGPLKKTASSARKLLNAVKSLSAMVRANARSVASTCARASSPVASALFDLVDPVSQAILDVGSGTSIFDPVLCEIAYRWFCPPGGLVLDPFAGGSVRGIIANRSQGWVRVQQFAAVLANTSPTGRLADSER